MDIFFEIHQDLPREGPGDTNSTIKAFSMIPDPVECPLILDLGCGPGAQTLDLAGFTNGKIVALDNHLPFLHGLKNKTRFAGLTKRVDAVDASMANLPFKNNIFDVIWSEGAIYIMGFETGLHSLRSILKSSGCVAVTEISWLKENPPQEVYSYWTNEYPGMHSIQQNLRICESSGFRLIDHFALPEDSWWHSYYNPIIKRLPELQAKYHNDPEALSFISATRKEIDVYRRFSDWYGYVFYIMQAE